MPSKKRLVARTGATSRIPSPEEAAKKITWFYELGRRVRERAAKEQIGPQEAGRLVADEMRENAETARKAAQFFSLYKSQREFERVRALCSKGRRPLTVNHVRQILTFRAKADRLEWLRKAAEYSWSADEFKRELKGSKKEKPGSGGPRFRRPVSLLQTLGQILGYSGEWLKRHEELWAQDYCWPPKVVWEVADTAEKRSRLQNSRDRKQEREREKAAVLQKLEVARERVELLRKAAAALGVRLKRVTEFVESTDV